MVDPEDDLPSDTYAGDFETTLIPHYDSTDSGSVRSSSSGVGVMGGHEPLPYQPQPTGGHSIFAPDGMGEHEHLDDDRVRAVAANSLWEKAGGKVMENNPEKETGKRIDLSKLTAPDKAALGTVLEGKIKEAYSLAAASRACRSSVENSFIRNPTVPRCMP